MKNVEIGAHDLLKCLNERGKVYVNCVLVVILTEFCCVSLRCFNQEEDLHFCRVWKGVGVSSSRHCITTSMWSIETVSILIVEALLEVMSIIRSPIFKFSE